MDTEEAQDVPKITTKDIFTLNFPSKLWILINTTTKIINWNHEGKSIIIDPFELDEYLHSPFSIFKYKSKKEFINEMISYGFRLQNTTNCEESGNSTNSKHKIIQEYVHEHFIQNRDDLIKNIVKNHDNKDLSDYNSQKVFSPFEMKKQSRHSDPCFGPLQSLSNVEKARLNLNLILKVQAENYALTKKISECEDNPMTNVSVIEVPADSYENPVESISGFEEHPDYAGFYGTSVTSSYIRRFFDEYLPVYAYGDEDGIQRTADNICQEDTASHSSAIVYPKSFRTVGAEYPSTIIPDEGYSQGSQSDIKDESSGFQQKSTGLEPIFAVDDDDEENNGKDDDISMDEYLKFKNSPIKTASNENMLEMKTEKAESCNDEDNENDFKNFYDQYRESMNVLYD